MVMTSSPDTGPAPSELGSDFFSPKTLAAYLEVPERTVYQWRHTGYGPPGIRVGRHVRYRRRDVERWLDEQAAKGPAA